MKIPVCIACVATAFLLGSLPTAAQQMERNVAVVSEDVAGRLDGFSFREGPESKLEFRGTALALAAEGSGEVEYQDGRARVDVSVRKLPDPASLGPYTTYVLWAVAADGRASNLGSIELRDGRGSLDTSTPLSTFGLVVSAEPHFAVTAPSKAIVLRNLGRSIKGERVVIQGLAERMDYSGLAPRSIDPRSRIPPELLQARYALDIARAAGVAEFATAEHDAAEAALTAAEAAQASKKYRDRKTAPRLAREAVQLAEEARRAAVSGREAAEAEARREAAAREAREAAEREARRQAELAAEEARRRGELEAAEKARTDLTARLNRVLPTRETDRGLVAELAGVQFGPGTAVLGPDARESLARFDGVVANFPELRLKVEGHTDSVGRYETNRELSMQRAIAVRDYLIMQGVPASTIDTAGLGPDRPVADNATADGRARNRRVEIVVTGGPVGTR